ncbi:hypothetical protein BB560_004473 [Smittium megazygosporum]|uniref:Clu domain-containing protein n=1 Tax=Smittium megazygosporum TaxID=133381 RepID=A0A2T9Z968_9FUNG|nr:hypothetical protein BB560_004473 [Smittium megazygosporum]
MAESTSVPDLNTKDISADSKGISIETSNEKTNQLFQQVPEMDQHNSSQPNFDEQNSETLPGSNSIEVKISVPNGSVLNLEFTGAELVQEIKQIISQYPEAVEYTCFDLYLNNVLLLNHLVLSEAIGTEINSPEVDLSVLFPNGITIDLREKNYSEREVRGHINKLLDLISGIQGKTDPAMGIDVGATIFPSVNSKVISKVKSSAKKSNGKSIPASSKRTSKNSDSKSQKSNSKPVVQKVYSPSYVPALGTISTQSWRLRTTPDSCIKQLSLSGWNPVRPDRHLKGDLLYIELTTLENATFFITASISGFYVNKSTSSFFDPSPVDPPKESHSLITLLRKISPKFTKNLESIQTSGSTRYPLELIPLNASAQPVAPWVVPPISSNDPYCSAKGRSSSYDIENTQDVYLKFGPRAAEAQRDWNEELQNIKEIDVSDLSEYELALKDSQLLSWLNEFTEAAVAGAMAVVDDEVVPLNPTELPSQYIYLRENIFFSKANDSRDIFCDIGGDSAAFVAASKDLEGVRLLNMIGAKDIFQLGTVLIDYRGQRITAQTLIPGILRSDNENFVVYGSVDNGKVIRSNPDFHKAIEPVAKQLRLKEHGVMDGEGEIHKIYTSLDVKGIKGADGRKYLVDLYRLFPLDVNFLENEVYNSKGEDKYPHEMVFFRSELLSLYWDNCMREQVKKIMAKKAESKDQSQAGSDDKTSETTKPENSEQHDGEVDSQNLQDIDSKLFLNSDVGVKIPDIGKSTQFNQEEFEKDKDSTLAVSKFLLESVIPGFLNDLISGSIAPITGKSLTKQFHTRGINMRYLGKIAEMIPSDRPSTVAIYSLFMREMIIRSLKHIVRDLFFAVDSRTLHPYIFAWVVNTVFGLNCDSVPQFSDVKQKIKETGIISGEQSLIDLVKSKVFQLYRFSLSDSWVKDYVLPYKRIILREISLKIGAQLALRNYDSLFSNKQTASSSAKNTSPADSLFLLPDDILNFAPLIKVSGSSVATPTLTLDYGRTLIAQGKKELGLSLIHNLCLLHEQRCGTVHPQTASSYSDLATCYHELGESATAIDLMHQAIISNERSAGLDDAETVFGYLNLAMFEHANDNTETALLYTNHALDLWKLIGTMDHPILSVIYSNIASMYQKLTLGNQNNPGEDFQKIIANSILFFELSANIREKCYGAENILTANAVLNLGKSIASSGDLKKAIGKIVEAYTVFNKLLGESDPKTVDAKEWLDRATALAVENEKNQRIASTNMLVSAAYDRFISLAPKGSPDKKMTLEEYNKMLVNGSLSIHIDENQVLNTVRNNKGVTEMSINDIYNYVVGGKKTKKSASSSKQQPHQQSQQPKFSSKKK